VDIHHPDGTPDLLQQIEHGTLALIAQHRAFGRAIPGIIVPNLHQYHHLGDGSTMTDNLLYDPQLKPYESNCTRSGTPDDRWAFTTRSAMNSYASISALAAAGRALRGTNDELSDECIRTAIRAWKDEQNHSQEPDRFAELLGGSGEIQAALQLYITTGEDAYREEFMQRIWTALDKSLNRNMQWAVQAVPFLDAEYREQLIPYVKKYREFNESLTGQNPYGVPITARGWAGNETIINWAITNYLLNRSFPGIIGPEYTYRGIDYIYGCHPYSDVSFVSGVGIDSKRVAYGNNRADYSFIAGGVVPGVLVIPPDYPEHKNDWPFLWGENEYVINICAEYIFLVNAVLDLGN
jgi:endoglucanase